MKRHFTKYPSNYVAAASETSGAAVRKKGRMLECEEDVDACGDINASSKIMAERVATKYDPIRKLLGEEEWGYLQKYLMDVDDRGSLQDILFNEDDWDAYCDWKMKKFHKKPAISASTRIKAARYLR